VDFTFRLVGTGWAAAHISDDTGGATVTASYLKDALGLLLEAVGLVLEGAEEARCAWAEEPGEYRRILERDGEQGHLRVLAFRDVERPEPDDRGTTIFETRQLVRVIAASIADGAQQVLTEYGEDEYVRCFGHPFPLGHLGAVHDRLAAD
jgi:hypothetical protein